jgi:foldase protein PrsA
MRNGESQIANGELAPLRDARMAIGYRRYASLFVFILVTLTACGAEGTPVSPATSSASSSVQPAASSPTNVTANNVAARVNGVVISLEQFNKQAAASEAFLRAQNVDFNSAEGRERLKQARRDALDDLIEQVLIEQAANEQGVKISDASLDAEWQKAINEAGGQAAFETWLKQNDLTREEFRRSLKINLLGAQLRDKVIAAAPTRGEQVHVRHILAQTRAQAQDLLAKLKAGGDFTKLAREHSLDISTKDNGGDLGWVPRGLLPPEVEKAAFALNKGQLSDVTPSALGFHIVWVVERDANRAIAPDMQVVLRENAFANWLETQKSKAKIERFAE